jgi:hypothetical protein
MAGLPEVRDGLLVEPGIETLPRDNVGPFARKDGETQRFGLKARPRRLVAARAGKCHWLATLFRAYDGQVATGANQQLTVASNRSKTPELQHAASEQEDVNVGRLRIGRRPI